VDSTLIPLWQRVFAVASELFSIKHADFVTFESSAVTKGISKVWRLPLRYMILPNGVDVNVFDKNRFNVAEESFSVFYGARIKRQKDQLTVVRAMAIVLQVEPRARLLLLGDPEELDYYDVVRKEVLRLGLDGFVEFHPSVSVDKLNYIRAKYPVHLIYSRFTGFDVSLGETLSFGVACVLSAIPPVKGIAIDGVNCLLVPPRNVEALAAAMIKLLQDPDLRRRLGKDARLTAEKQLNWTGLSQNFIEWLSKCT
jgi:glycosyltransferase involved in cell wall biosynthesis